MIDYTKSMITATTAVLNPARRQTLTGHAYEQLLAAICSGALSPGQKLVIDSIARKLGLSITPVREALRRLQHEGLVTEVPYSGMQVSAFSTEELRELFGIRGVLEGYAIRMATDRLTDADLETIQAELDVLEDSTERGDVAAFRRHNTRFHEAILHRGMGKGALAEMIRQLTRNTERYRAAGAVLDQAYLEAAQAEHRRLVEFLRQRRADEAEMLTRNHALTFVNHLSRRLESAE